MENSLFLPASHLMTTLYFSAEEWGWKDINFLIVKSRNGSHVNVLGAGEKRDRRL